MTLAEEITPPDNAKSPRPGWKLIFDDEFNGKSLDTTKWASLLPWAGQEDHHWHNDQYASYLTDEDVSVSDGKLHLSCRKVDIQGKTRKFSYTAGMVHTSKTFRFTYGYAEVSAQAPMEAGPGMWPAFWTLTDGWPPEFDVIELWTSEPRIHQGYCFAKPKGQGWNSYHEQIGPRGYHTYAMEWGPGYIFFELDGKVTKRVYGDDVTAKPEYLILNSGICSGKGNKPPTAATKFPNSFDVDYCRVYARPDVVPFHNGNFEDADHWPWTLSQGVAIDEHEKHSGSKALHLVEGAVTAEQKVFGLKPDTQYVAHAWAKSANAQQPVRFGAKSFGGEEVFQPVTSTEWREYTITLKTDPKSTTAIVYCFNPGSPGGFFDDIRFEEKH